MIVTGDPVSTKASVEIPLTSTLEVMVGPRLDPVKLLDCVTLRMTLAVSPTAAANGVSVITLSLGHSETEEWLRFRRRQQMSLYYAHVLHGQSFVAEDMGTIVGDVLAYHC